MKTIRRAYKIRAYPTQEQRRLFARTEGACRYVYNRCLFELGESYKAKKAGLNRGISNAGFGEIRRQIEYKANWRGGAVLFADRWAPTSRTCSECGTYQAEFSLRIRTWTCPDCGAVHDRDENAAKNIVVFATGGTPEARAGNARGLMPNARGGGNNPGPGGAIHPTHRAADETRTDVHSTGADSN